VLGEEIAETRSLRARGLVTILCRFSESIGALSVDTTELIEADGRSFENKLSRGNANRLSLVLNPHDVAYEFSARTIKSHSLRPLTALEHC